MERTPRKERERARHRVEILNAAEEVFAEKGLHGATTEEIARRAEFAVGTLYNFFSSKEDLLTAVMLYRVEQMRAAIAEILSDEKLDPIEVIERFIEEKARFFAAHMPFFRLLHTELLGGTTHLTAKWQDKVRPVYEESMKMVAAVIERGIRGGFLRKMPARDLASFLSGVTNAFLFELLDSGDGKSYQSKVPLMKELFFRGALAK